MRQYSAQALLAAALLLALRVNAHGDDHGDTDMDHDHKDTMSKPEEEWELSYFAAGQHTGTIMAHIILETVAWCFVLPVAVMFSVAHSRYTIPTQFLFLIINGVGMFFGFIYNASTPDLYENNAHHKIGWIVSSVVVAQVIIGLIYVYSKPRDSSSAQYERASFLPVSSQNMRDHEESYPSGAVHQYRWSGDSGHGASRPTTPTTPDHEQERFVKPEDDLEEVDDRSEEQTPLARGFLRSKTLDRFFAKRIPGMVSSSVLRTLRIVYNVIDWIILPFGFIALTTGGVTYGGVFKGSGIFSGLAHFIKGGIFFWYGLVVLARYMGCFAKYGWAWNLKPVKSRAPTGEFLESAAIFTYGATNVFLEHLGGWGKEWTAQDLEHVSIAVMFFGAGLCGMLVESKRVRDWFNRNILGSSRSYRSEEDESNNVSFNPMPALIIFLLGIMMGGHKQKQMVSTMVHQQWGSLLAGAAMARGFTYILTYLKPPTSCLPSRPPSELVGAFCLISGGMIFMFSASDIMDVMVWYELNAMFTFNIAVGLSAFIMAWEIVVIAIKAWAEKRESTRRHARAWSAP